MTADTCRVSVWTTHPPVTNGRNRGTRVIHTHPCCQPITRYGLCEKHAAEKERLT